MLDGILCLHRQAHLHLTQTLTEDINQVNKISKTIKAHRECPELPLCKVHTFNRPKDCATCNDENSAQQETEAVLKVKRCPLNSVALLLLFIAKVNTLNGHRRDSRLLGKVTQNNVIVFLSTGQIER